MKNIKQVVTGCCVVAMLLTGCGSGIRFDLNGEVYTQEDMTHFASEKVAIEELTALDVESIYSDFEIIASDGYYIEYSYYYINNEPTLTINDGKLVFSDRDMNTGNYSIQMNEDNYLKIYIPTTTNFDEIKIAKSSGDCFVGSFLANEVSITNHYGETMISNSQAKQLNLFVSSGKITVLKSNIKDVDITNNYGELEIKTSTFSELKGSFNSGNVGVEDSSIDQVEIDNAYGSVALELIGKYEDYKYNIINEYGTTKINDEVLAKSVLIDRGADKLIDLSVTSGDIEITFTE